MLSYQHIYHAGNFADVQKPIKLIQTLTALTKKNAPPLTWIDTHAGRGLYNIQHPEAQRLKEYKDGYLSFRKKHRSNKDLPPLYKTYFDIVENVNKGGFNIYPGSSYIAAKLLRPQDNLIACELHKGEIEHLKKSLTPFQNVKILQKDGLSVLKNHAPHIKHGGTLIDPSYEIKSEYEDVGNATREIMSKNSNLITLIWVPLLPAKKHDILYDILNKHSSDKLNITIEEHTIRDQDDTTARGLYGSGMIRISRKISHYR